MTTEAPFYGKFIKKTGRREPDIGQKKDRNDIPGKKPASSHSGSSRIDRAKAASRRAECRNTSGSAPQGSSCRLGTPVFAELTGEACSILEHFPNIIERVLSLDSKKKQGLPQHIHTLFHELTDERSSRKAHYLNNPVKLSAYTHYYMWWNLVRLTKLLQNLDMRLESGDCAADFGSGPLTFICALWIAKPELRAKSLTWYCVDISNKALAFGEEIFLALCAYTGQNSGEAAAPWRIKKICGSFGIPLNEKAALVTEANMFNEIFWDSRLSLDEQAEKAQSLIARYLKPDGSVLLIEPGIPLAGEFLSLIRSRFLKAGFSVTAPCPHRIQCCFPNRRPAEKTGNIPAAYNKWCHFTFTTSDSPKNLLHLSDSAQLGKERASLSFLYCSAPESPLSVPDGKEAESAFKNKLPVRICSDIIMPEPQRIGRYACSARGFMFITGPAYKESVLNTAVSGSLLLLPAQLIREQERDKKTGALLVRLDLSLSK